MGKRIDLTGKIFGRLTVIEFSHYKRYPSGSGVCYWKTKCDCGNETVVASWSLRKGMTVSCGKHHREKHKKEDGYSALTSLYNSYKKRILKKKLEFSLERNIFENLTKQNCYYCGQEPKSKYRIKHYAPYIYNGLDRVDSSKGYIESNVVPCCPICNVAKSNLSLNNFYSWILKVSDRIKSGKINI